MKKINRNELIWMLILSALFVGLARLLLTGEILFFLHPKMIKFLVVTEVILFAMIVFQKSRIYTESTTKVQMGQFVFLLPITVMMMRPTYLNSEAIVNKGLNLRQIPLSSETFQNVDLNKKSSEQTAEEERSLLRKRNLIKITFYLCWMRFIPILHQKGKNILWRDMF